MAVPAKDLRTGDKVTINASTSVSDPNRPWFAPFPHVNAYGEVVKTSPLTIKIAGGVDVVVSKAGLATFQRERKLSAKDMKKGWVVGVAVRPGSSTVSQIRVMSVPMTFAPPPKTKKP